MTCCNCNCRGNDTLAAIVASAILGVIAAFLQISGVIAVTPVFLWVTLGIAVGYLAVLLLSTGTRRSEQRCCLCPALSAVLAGILGSVLFSLIGLAVGIAGVVGAVLVGLTVASLALVITGSASLIRCLADCQ